MKTQPESGRNNGTEQMDVVDNAHKYTRKPCAVHIYIAKRAYIYLEASEFFYRIPCAIILKCEKFSAHRKLYESESVRQVIY